MYTWSSPPSKVKNTTEDGSPSPTEVLAETVALYGMYLTGNNEKWERLRMLHGIAIRSRELTQSLKSDVSVICGCVV